MSMKTIQSILLFTLLSFFVTIAVEGSDSYLTPLPGDPLRKQLLNALRSEVKRIHGLDVVFVVRHLRVKDGWAWAHTSPQSPDGKNKYEDISALIKLEEGKWKVQDIPCTEVDNPECIDGASYFKQLEKRYPGVSVELFPTAAVQAASSEISQ
jgi:hypothetical protein